MVAINTDQFEGSTICCAFVPNDGVKIEPSTLRQQLSQRLPQYMMPSHWMCLEALPLNGNGKIDRPKLRESFQRLKQEMTA